MKATGCDILIILSWEIVESIPSGLNYSIKSQHKSTYNAWIELLMAAEKSVDIVSVYWNMRDKTEYKTSWQAF
jgi:hypothetical protein